MINIREYWQKKNDIEESDDGFAMLQEIAKSRHCLVKRK